MFLSAVECHHHKSMNKSHYLTSHPNCPVGGKLVGYKQSFVLKIQDNHQRLQFHHCMFLSAVECHHHKLLYRSHYLTNYSNCPVGGKLVGYKQSFVLKNQGNHQRLQFHHCMFLSAVECH
uniref:Uncharacterized protein n=1 Tax=Ciona intestinalis TaxID=7719 RepID=F6RAP5_CIOIN